MFEFTEDRKPQGETYGPAGAVCMADQSRFRSIWGVVNGKRVGPWTGRMIESGEIRSADKRARMGGVAVEVEPGKYNDVEDAGATFREYQVPIEDVEQWNRYEAQLGNDAVRAFQAREESKRELLGRDPELKIDALDIHMSPPQIIAEQQRSVTITKPGKRQATPAQLAGAAKARAAAAAKRAAKSTPPA